jgi:hypothetical protein
MGGIRINRLRGKNRALAVSTVFAALLAAAPDVANASTIGGSYLSFNTSTTRTVQDIDRWAGASTGHARAYGNVVNSPETQPSLHAFVKRDINNWPDGTVSSGYLVYSAGYYSAGYGGTSVSNRYYTEVGVVNEPVTHSAYVQATN